MSYHNKLINEITIILDRLANENREWSAKWIAHEIVENHKDGIVAGEDADYLKYCSYDTTRKQVTKCINRRAEIGMGGEPSQYNLPGYDYIQSHYVIIRNNIPLGVPVGLITDLELEEKENQIRTMSITGLKHADELKRYRLSRRAVA